MLEDIYDHIIIGGGAAGFFAAVNLLENNKDLKVAILERASVPMVKLGLTGGGRCNIANACYDVKEIIKNYPRGGRELRTALYQFGVKDTIHWFCSHGIDLKEENEGRLFPVSEDANQVVQYLLGRACELGVKLYCRHDVCNVQYADKIFTIEIKGCSKFAAKSVLVATGGMNRVMPWLEKMGHTITEPIPALFTFNTPSSDLLNLSGLSSSVKLSLKGSKFKSEGSILLTHWGFSGPAILRLSSFAARWLHDREYRAELSVDWVPEYNEEQLFNFLKSRKENDSNKKIFSHSPLSMPYKLWARVIAHYISEECVWSAITDKTLRKIAAVLKNDVYAVQGRGIFKHQFVTAGGVDLKGVDFKDMQSKLVPNLYFAGEVLDIDAVTGGYNLQSAWTTAYVAARSQ